MAFQNGQSRLEISASLVFMRQNRAELV